MMSDKGQEHLMEAAHEAAVRKLQPFCQDIPSLADARILMEFYRQNVEPVCLKLGLHPITQATALWLMDRFYLRYSILDFDPKHVMFAAILVASKLNGHHLTMAQWEGECKADPTILMDLEVILLEAVDFDLDFYDPFTAAYARSCLEEIPDWEQLESHIKGLIVYTDALLTHTAPEIVTLALSGTPVPTAQGNRDRYKAIDRRVILCRQAYHQNKAL